MKKYKVVFYTNLLFLCSGGEENEQQQFCKVYEVSENESVETHIAYDLESPFIVANTNHFYKSTTVTDFSITEMEATE